MVNPYGLCSGLFIEAAQVHDLYDPRGPIGNKLMRQYMNYKNESVDTLIFSSSPVQSIILLITVVLRLVMIHQQQFSINPRSQDHVLFLDIRQVHMSTGRDVTRSSPGTQLQIWKKKNHETWSCNAGKPILTELKIIIITRHVISWHGRLSNDIIWGRMKRDGDSTIHGRQVFQYGAELAQRLAAKHICEYRMDHQTRTDLPKRRRAQRTRHTRWDIILLVRLKVGQDGGRKRGILTVQGNIEAISLIIDGGNAVLHPRETVRGLCKGSRTPILPHYAVITAINEGLNGKELEIGRDVRVLTRRNPGSQSAGCQQDPDRSRRRAWQAGSDPFQITQVMVHESRSFKVCPHCLEAQMRLSPQSLAWMCECVQKYPPVRNTASNCICRSRGILANSEARVKLSGNTTAGQQESPAEKAYTRTEVIISEQKRVYLNEESESDILRQLNLLKYLTRYAVLQVKVDTMVTLTARATGCDIKRDKGRTEERMVRLGNIGREWDGGDCG